MALPPLFGEHILEAELEPGGVELGPGEVKLMIIKQYVGVSNGIAAVTSLKHHLMLDIYVMTINMTVTIT